LDAEALSASAGDPSATERIQREQRQREQRRRLDDQLRGSASPEFIAEAKGKLEAAIAAENEAAATKDRLESEKKATQEKEKQTREAQRSAEETQREAEQKARLAEQAAKEQERIAKARRGIDQDIALTEAKLRGDKGAEEDILQQRDIDRAMESGATFEQAANLAATNALQRQMEAASAAEGQGRMTGSFGASSLQRIGFANDQFFDTRRQQNTGQIAKEAVKELREIRKTLENPATLILKENG
jgi:colicin import membrane protein